MQSDMQHTSIDDRKLKKKKKKDPSEWRSPFKQHPTPPHPPRSSYTVAYMQHHPVTLCPHPQQKHGTVAIAGRTLDIYLPLCLPFAVIVTPLDVSLEQDAHLPPCFYLLSLSRLCLCGVLFSNAKPPLGVERVWSSCSTGVSRKRFGYT